LAQGEPSKSGKKLKVIEPLVRVTSPLVSVFTLKSGGRDILIPIFEFSLINQEVDAGLGESLEGVMTRVEIIWLARLAALIPRFG